MTVPRPPAATRRPHATTIHGRTLDDPFFWLRERDDSEVRAYLEAENAYAEAYLAPFAQLREKLYGELVGRLEEEDASYPYRRGGWLYYSRNARGKQHQIHCRKESEEAPEQVVLDLNELGNGAEYVALGAFEPSDDGHLLAYTLDRTGFREYTLLLLDLRTMESLSEAIPKVTSVAWAADGKTLLYTIENSAKRSYRALRHRLGATGGELVYEESDERFSLAVERSRSGDYLFLSSASLTTSEVRYLPATRPDSAPRLVAAREQDHLYDLEHAGERFFVRSNATGRNFALFEAPAATPERAHWRQLRAHDPAVMLENVAAFAGHLVLGERTLGLNGFRIVELATGAERTVPFREPAYRALPGPNFVFQSRSFRYHYQSMTTPESVFDVDLASGSSTLCKQQPVPGYDASLYRAERIEATAADGVRVPISLVRRHDRATDSPGPALLSGYGAYGISNDVRFDANAVSLLDRGFAIAIAHVRGGGELGKRWHDAGRMTAKRNSFTDFVTCAEELVRRGTTAPNRLAITGGSAGGLLIGAAVNLRPELFAVVLSNVPFVDVIQTMLDPTLPLTVGEFEEWGDPRLAEQFATMLSYSPYDNVAPKAYPAMLVRTSFWDSQVMYWEPAKYVAKLRATKSDSNPLLLLSHLDAGGHGGLAGRYDKLRDRATDFAFLLDRLGVRE